MDEQILLLRINKSILLLNINLTAVSFAHIYNYIYN